MWSGVSKSLAKITILTSNFLPFGMPFLSFACKIFKVVPITAFLCLIIARMRVISPSSEALLTYQINWLQTGKKFFHLAGFKGRDSRESQYKYFSLNKDIRKTMQRNECPIKDFQERLTGWLQGTVSLNIWLTTSRQYGLRGGGRFHFLGGC